ncbi:MAG: hypothetical protein EOO50_06545 [Flavobacterium sp.]|uniref:TonB-dependent receptor n=1 Tax=Flavobacterium sp. TaxID=239 RepID=UPI0011FAC0E0|nr:TonB-dependent receptor plug domain-containing protein [Flavobacterium sp.]RZJ67177.1 MAG: hypothetical protein EOO50_06545 [Flavobacterium sp.]
MRTHFLLFACCITFAQQNGKALPLRDYLKILEARFSVNFSFIENEIEKINVVAPDENSIGQQIESLEMQTNLTFEFITANYIVIRKKSKSEICAQIIDSETGLPISGASVKSGSNTTYSNEKGEFCLTSKSPEITISHVSYDNLSLATTNLPASPKIKLSLHVEILSETFVPVLLTRGIRKKPDGSYDILSKNSGLLPGLTEPDVLQTMQQLPGAVSFDETISNLSIRGGTHDQNLFLWNGIRLFQTGHFFGLISALNPNLSHSITFYKNASPASLGEAVSGTVLIETLPESGNYFENSIGMNMLNFDFNTAFKTSPNTSWQFSGRRSTTDFFDSPTYRRYSERIFQNTKITNIFVDQEVDYRTSENFYFYDFTAQFRQKIGSKSELRFNGIFIENELEVYQRLNANAASDAQENELKQQSTAGNLVFKTDWNSKHKSTFSAFFSRYMVDSEDRPLEETNRLINQHNVITDKGITVGHDFHLNEKIILKGGYQVIESSLKNENRDNLAIDVEDSRFLLTHALFVQGELTLARWFLSGGIRQQYFQTLDRFRTEPRFLASYRVNKDLDFSISGELKSQTAQQSVYLQEDFFGLEKRQWTLADGNGTPLITSSQISSAVTYKKWKWLFSLEPFYKKVSHITSKSQGFQNQFEFENAVGSYRVLGVEFLVQKQWRDFTAWLNYHYNRNEYRFESFAPSDFPNIYSIPHSLRSGLIYDKHKWQFALGTNWFSGKYYTEPSSRIPVFDENQDLTILYKSPNSDRLDDYFQVNFSGSFTQAISKKANMKWGISVQNLLDKTVSINKSYRINSVNSAIEEVNVLSLARTFNGFVRVYF